MVSVEGIEPSPHVPKTRTLPLRHTEINILMRKLDNYKSLYQLSDETPYQPTTVWCSHATFKPDPILNNKLKFVPDPVLTKMERVGGFEPLSWSLEGSSATVDTIPA